MHPLLASLVSVFLSTTPMDMGLVIVETQDPEIRWQSCASTAADSLRITECAMVETPLRAADPSGPTISVAVKRVRASGGTKRQLWFLDGGPGDAGRASVGRLARFLADDPYLDVYTFDHRGVGGTAILTCPEQQDPASPDGVEITGTEWDTCMTVIRSRLDLDALTMTETARDLHALIEKSRAPDTPVFLMGASYGTLLANRYLQLFPDQPDGVILDGIVPADWGFDEFDAGLDNTGRRVLARCADDSACRDRLGLDPVSTVEALFEQLDEGHCSGLGLTPELVRLVLGIFLMSDDYPAAYIPALTYRLQRCAWHDRMTVLHLFRTLNSVGEPPSHSPVLQRHVSMSEMWSADAPTQEQLDTALSGYIMTTGVSASFARTVDNWPAYAADSLDDLYPEYRGPMLLFHGTLDPTMPVERLAELRGRYTGVHQTFITVPDAGHVVINESECVRSMYYSFLADPERPLDTSCVATSVTLDFEGTPEASVRIFGSEDLWGDEVGRVDYAWFAARYRLPAAAVFVILPLVGWLRRRRSPSPPAERRTIRWITGALAWIGISTGFYVVIGIVPLLLPYTGLLAMGTVTAVAGLHLLIGWGLSRWMALRSRRPVTP